MPKTYDPQALQGSRVQTYVAVQPSASQWRRRRLDLQPSSHTKPNSCHIDAATSALSREYLGAQRVADLTVCERALADASQQWLPHESGL